MMSLNMVEGRLPPGFRFHPRDDELICDYLMKMVAGCDQLPLLIVVDLNKSEPWDIPENACVGGKDYYFYSQRDRKYATGLRTNRATLSGYWKATGKDRPVIRKGGLVGMRKTLVFYQGRAPKGKKTDWVMHEFRLEGSVSSSKEDWVLCRVFFKNSKDVIAKQDMDDQYEEYSPSSSSLPPLMDSYITFDHQTTINNHHHGHQQVPCFSNNNIFAATTTADHINHQTPHHLHHHHHHHQQQPPPFSYLMGTGTAGEPDSFGSYLMASSSCEEKKVLKAVLNQLTKMEYCGAPPPPPPPHPSFQDVGGSGGGCSGSGGGSSASTTSESFLSEVALSTMWNNQYSS